MSDSTQDDAAFASQMLDEIRASRQRIEAQGETWSMRLTFGEVDLLLAAVDERDRLRREFCDMPDEAPRPAVSLDPLRDEHGVLSLPPDIQPADVPNPWITEPHEPSA